MSIRSDITQEQLDSLNESEDYATDFEVMAARASIERDLALVDLIASLRGLIDQISSILRMKYGR